MQNIEIKARCADLDAVRRLLTQHGLQPAARMRQTDTYFAAPHGRLKLREVEGETAELIQYDRPDDTTARISDYLIVPIAEPGLLKMALERALGVRIVVVKRRELYRWRHTRIHLDEVESLGGFLELETVVRDQPLAEAETECQEVQAALGIQEADLVAGSYADMLGN